ncbi:MAG: DUF488 family protein [Desulfuromonadales bacterium]|nr:DUF488 family protein [Desulfuromonadales bacterium]
MPIRIKRVYDPPQAADGCRILVDRIWPRGVKKEEAKVTQWAKDLAPSDQLRRWYGHDPERWDEFRQRYFRELETRQEAVDNLLARAASEELTLLFAARDERQNNAVALLEYLQQRQGQRG